MSGPQVDMLNLLNLYFYMFLLLFYLNVDVSYFVVAYFVLISYYMSPTEIESLTCNVKCVPVLETNMSHLRDARNV